MKQDGAGLIAASQGKSTEQAALVTQPAISTTQLTAEQVRVLSERRSELTSQLSTQVSRARSIANEIRGAPPEARPALETRYNVVGARVVELEKELIVVNQQLVNAPRALMPQISSTSVPPPRGGMSDEAMVLSVLTILFVLAPLSLALAWRIVKRSFRKNEPLRDAEQSQRLKRMEHAVDAVAIEVERISEGQRFLTQLFGKERQNILPEPVAANDTARRES